MVTKSAAWFFLVYPVILAVAGIAGLTSPRFRGRILLPGVPFSKVRYPFWFLIVIGALTGLLILGMNLGMLG